MRLMKAREFAKLPAGTVFQEFEEYYTSGLCIKGETLQGDDRSFVDFWQVNLLRAIDLNDTASLDEAMSDSTKELETDYETQGRWGLCDDDAMVLVYSPEDVQDLIKALQGDFLRLREQAQSI